MHGFLLKKWRWLLTILVLAVIGGGLCWWQRAQAAQQFVQSKTPTFFFHGYGSSHHAEEHMANAAELEQPIRLSGQMSTVLARLPSMVRSRPTPLIRLLKSTMKTRGKPTIILMDSGLSTF